MEISRQLFLDDDQYMHDICAKSQLYLHHTVNGSAKGTVDYWNSNVEKIGTAYIIDKDGTIYNVFPDENWAWHLGLKTASNTIANKQSIGIEIVSEGALRNGNELNSVLLANGLAEKFNPEYLYAFDIDPNPALPKEQWFKNAKKLFNIMNDKSQYFDCGLPWRGYSYYDEYTEAQLSSVFWLVKFLCDKYGIAKKLIDGDRTRFDQSLITGHRGILAHSNVRSDKSDVHCNFPYDKLEEYLAS